MLPRWFRVLFVLVMLTLSAVMAMQLFRQASLRSQIVQLTDELSISQQRLAKQQLEYDQALASLPQIQQELALVAPKAEAVYQQEQTLRDQRKTLRAQSKELQSTLAALQPELDAVRSDLSGVQSAITLMQSALTDMQALMQLLK